LPLPALRETFLHLNVEILQVAKQVCKVWRNEVVRVKVFNAKKLAQLAFTWIAANEGSLVLAGGMARWLLDKEPTSWTPSDADLFWYGPTCGETKVLKIGVPKVQPFRYQEDCDPPEPPSEWNRCVEHPSEHTPRIINMHYTFGRIQMIISKFETPSAVVDSFDLSVCMVGYTAPNQIVFGDAFTAQEPITYFLVVPGTKNMETHAGIKFIVQDNTTYKRLIKYMRRLNISSAVKAPMLVLPPFFDVYWE